MLHAELLQTELKCMCHMCFVLVDLLLSPISEDLWQAIGLV
jgi:hypothetical protein